MQDDDVDLDDEAGTTCPARLVNTGRCLPARRPPLVFAVPGGVPIVAASEGGMNAGVVDWMRWQVVKATEASVCP